MSAIRQVVSSKYLGELLRALPCSLWLCGKAYGLSPTTIVCGMVLGLGVYLVWLAKVSDRVFLTFSPFPA